MRRLPLRSPPRMRGKVVQLCGHAQNMGITPACAGKSLQCSKEFLRFWDHPRVCGEKGQMVLRSMAFTGSPPRMRGKDGVNDSPQAVTGITPACAGKSEKTRSITTTRRDHPRVCGEKTCSCTYKQLQRGSPPRMRGKDPPAAAMQGCPGITPAYAGKRRSSFPAPWCWRDHPRVCGEKRSGAAQSAQT